MNPDTHRLPALVHPLLVLALAALAFVALALGADSAVAATPIDLGPADEGPGVALDAAGTAHLSWATAGLGNTALHYCRIDRGGSGCAAAHTFPQVGTFASDSLGRGRGADQRAASVRQALLGAVDGAFGDSPDERLQRAAIERGYLDPDGGHVVAMQELNFSRTTYFRRRATAADRVADFVLSER